MPLLLFRTCLQELLRDGTSRRLAKCPPNGLDDLVSLRINASAEMGETQPLGNSSGNTLTTQGDRIGAAIVTAIVSRDLVCRRKVDGLPTAANRAVVDDGNRG